MARNIQYMPISIPLVCAVVVPGMWPVVKLGGGIPGDLRSPTSDLRSPTSDDRPPPLILDPPHFTRRSLGYCACLNAPFDVFQLFNHRPPHTKLWTKTDFSSARWDGMLYACSKLFPESDKRIVYSSFKLRDPPPVAGQFNHCIHLITRQLITDLFRTYRYQRQTTTRTWWRLRLSHDSHWNVESLWSGRRVHRKNYKRSRRLAFWSASALSLTPSDTVNFCAGDRKKSSNATCVNSTRNCSGAQPSVPKQYKELKVRVLNTVDRCLPSEILVYLRAIAWCASFLFLAM